MLAGLADESYRVRVEATRGLWELGEKALPDLREAAGSDDPEIAMRARDLLRKIELGILPDSSPEIAELVVRYDEGSPRVRREVIDRLRQMRAWRQLLKIHAMERDQDTLNMIEGVMQGVALDAAREALAAAKPDPALALSYLEMAKPGPAEWMAAAVIHRTEGTLEKELAKIPHNAGPELQSRRYAMLAAAGRPAEAAEAASAAGLEIVAAQLRLLCGDPEPWLRIAPVSEEEMAAPGLDAYREFAIRRWKGGEPRPDDLRKFRRLAEAGDEEEQEQGLALLYLIGDVEHADKLFAQRFPMWAFAHHETFERIDEALAAAGLDPSEPDFAAWAAKRFHVLIHKPDEEVDEVTELAIMGGFLEEHGMGDEVKRAYLPGLKELAERDVEQFLSTCARLFGGSYGTPVVEPVLAAALAFARDDEAAWQRVVTGIFGRESSVSDLWEWLGALDPELSPSARLEWMATLSGHVPDRQGRVKTFLDKAWPAVEAMNDADKERRLTHLARASMRSPDPEDYLKMVDLAGRVFKARDAGNPYATSYYRHFLAARGRWREAADLWLDWVSQAPENPSLRAHAAACLRKAGDAKAADFEERMAERLCLGEPLHQTNCALAFALTGDFERAGKWWLRAATEATTPEAFADSFMGNDREYGTGGPLLSHARETGDWKLAAALSEAECLQYAISGGNRTSTTIFLRRRLNADMARVFASPVRADGLETLGRIHQLAATDGSLADHFYPTLRERGLTAKHDEWFEESWARLGKLVARFPDGDNLRNTAAWTASRANRRLDEAEAHSAKSLELRPRQAAYLDTMAEVWFVRREREKALRWSMQAVLAGNVSDHTLIRQHERFRTGAFPKP